MDIDKIRNIGLDKLVTQVYDFDSLTTDELMCKFAQKINIIIEHLKYIDDRCYNSDKAMELKLQYLLNEGLEEQIAKRLLKLIDDGTLGKIINETLLAEINEKLNTMATLYINKSGDITSLINDFVNNNDNIIINIGNGNYTCSGIDLKDRRVLIRGNGATSNLIIGNQPPNTPGIYSNTTNKILFDNVKFTINFGISRDTQPPLMFRYGNSVEFRNCIFDGTNSNDDIYTNIHIRELKTFNFKNNVIENYKGYFIVGQGMNNGNTNIDNVSFIGNIINSNNRYADSIFNIDNEYNKDSIITISNNIAKRESTVLLGHAFGVGFVTNATISNNVIKNYHIGFDIDNPYRVNVNNNIVINELGDFDNAKTTIGIRIGASSPSQSHINNRRCKDVIVNGNYVFGYNQGLSLGSDLYNTVISNNTIENCINHIYCYKLFDSSITNNKFICSDVTTKVMRLFSINNSQINNNVFENKNNVTIVLFSIVSSSGLESNNVTINNNVNRSNITNTTIFEGLGNCTNFEVKNNKGINDISRSNLSKIGIMIPKFENVYDNLKYAFTNTTMTGFAGTSINVTPVDSSIKQIASDTTITKNHTNTIIKNGAIATININTTPIMECLGLTFVIENVDSSNATVKFSGFVLNTNLLATGGTLTLLPKQKCIVHYNKNDSKVYASVY